MKRYHLIIALIIMSILAFTRLGDRFLWIDEGVTASLGKNILTYGYPRVWDGVNLITTTNGNDFNEKLVFVKENWLPFYVAAFGQLFGSSNFHLRVWFVILGILGAFNFYRLSCHLLSNKNAAIISLWLYVLSVPILLYIRQVRYYSIGLLFVILTCRYYVEYVQCRKKVMLIKLSMATILLFHSHYMFFSVTMAVLGSTYIIFDRKLVKLKNISLYLMITSLFILPWLIYVRGHSQQIGDRLSGSFYGIHYFKLQLLGYLWQIQTYFLPFITLVSISFFLWLLNKLLGKRLKVRHVQGIDGIPLAKIYAQNSEENLSRLQSFRQIWILISFIIVNVAAASLFTVQYCTRFLLPCLPACYMISAYFVSVIRSKNKAVGTVTLILLIFTNVLNIAPYIGIKYSKINPSKIESVVKSPLPYFQVSWNWPFEYNLETYLKEICYIRSYLFDYIYEIRNDYDDANEGMIRFLWKYARSDDKVLVYGPHEDVVVYYTGLQVINRLIPGLKAWPGLFDSYPNSEKFFHLTSYPEKSADWIIARPIYYSSEENNTLGPIIDEAIFEKIEIAYPDAPYTPEIWYHSFWTDRKYPNFYIYRNRKTTLPIGNEKIIGKDKMEI